MHHILTTGQTCCWDMQGEEIPCRDTGQDGEIQAGIPWPEVRFELQEDLVHDRLTGLIWTRDANINTFPCTWLEAFEQIRKLNRKRYAGKKDWRLPNRNELRSLMSYQARKPSLPDNHPFSNVFLGWYWSSTTAAISPAYAWSVHLEGARMFYGRKDQYQLFWPVRGQSPVLPETGQKKCYDDTGRETSCSDTGQDPDLLFGAGWPRPRFTEKFGFIIDRLTGLGWYKRCDLVSTPVDWKQAFEVVAEINSSDSGEVAFWRLPNINELASLVDCSRHSPALPADHPFQGMHDGYWSSTTSFFETDWAWVLYLNKGACGVGHKPVKAFYVWPVTTLNFS